MYDTTYKLEIITLFLQDFGGNSTDTECSSAGIFERQGARFWTQGLKIELFKDL